MCRDIKKDKVMKIYDYNLIKMLFFDLIIFYQDFTLFWFVCKYAYVVRFINGLV